MSGNGGNPMSTAFSCAWSGVFPAVTTQFDSALEVDLPATQKVQKALLHDGVHGLVLMGTVGEGNSLSAEEKRSVLGAAVELGEGKVPIIAGVSEFTTAAAASFARDAERLGATGLMVLPAMVYVPTPAELEYHFRAVAAATALPIMLYNNPPSYRVNIDIATLGVWRTFPISSRSRSPRPIRGASPISSTPSANASCCLPGSMMWPSKRCSWVRRAGCQDSRTPFRPSPSPSMPPPRRAISSRRAQFTAGSCRSCTWMRSTIWSNRIKLAEQIMGRGTERVRPPRLPLAGERRAAVIAMVERARDTRPR